MHNSTISSPDVARSFKIKRLLYLFIYFGIFLVFVGCNSSKTAPTNNAPVATAQSVNVSYNIATAITLTGTDADSDSLTYTIVTGPTHGSLSGSAPNLTYTPTSGYLGDDSFTFKVNDGTVDSSAETVSITVTHISPSMYFCPGANPSPDYLWVTVANWYQDSGCSTLANRIPLDGDSVYVEGNTFTDQPGAILLASFVGNLSNNGASESANISIGAGGILTVSRGYWFGSSDASATVTFNDGTAPNYTSNYGTVSGNATFNGTSTNGNGTHTGTVAGNATFNDTSNNTSTGVVNGTITWGAGNPNEPLAANSNIYFYNDGSQPDASWSTVSNWWRESGHILPAGRVPANGDSVYLVGNNAPTSGASPQISVTGFDSSAMLASFDFASSSVTHFSSLIISSGGTLKLGVAGDTAGLYLHAWRGTTEDTGITAIFQGSSMNAGFVGGGTIVFSDASHNDGYIGQVQDNSIGVRPVGGGNTTFNDMSYDNYAPGIDGSVTCNTSGTCP